MGRHKKKFIDKKHAVKFQLVHRSQKDPLFLDENVGEHVLVPINPSTNRDLVALVNGLTLGGKDQKDSLDELEKRKAEQQKYGIYFDDEYNYLQHLKERSSELKVEAQRVEDDDNDDDDSNDKNNSKIEIIPQKPKLQLPSSVFASEYEEDVGYFNLAAPNTDPKINWDPEIVELLDEDSKFDYNNPENLLEDDFFVKANTEIDLNVNLKKIKEESDVQNSCDEYSNSTSDSEDSNLSNDDYEENESLKEFETRSRFTNYSMTSSVIRRNENLQYLDSHFENIFAQYDEDQIGALDTEEIDGYRDAKNLVIASAIEEMQKLKSKIQYQTEQNSKNKNSLKTVKETDEDKSDEISEVESNEEDNEQNTDEYEYIYVKERDDDRLDCESIIDMYSNTSNLPQIISETTTTKKLRQPLIRVSKKTGLPVLINEEKTIEKNKNENSTQLPNELLKRRPDETKEEKKQRKQAVKEHRRERRVEKKLNKLAFKEEKTRQLKGLNNLQQSSVTVKIN